MSGKVTDLDAQVVSNSDNSYVFVSKNHDFAKNKKLQELYKNGEFCDITFVCGSARVDAHRVILASSCASHYFATKCQAQNSEVEISGMHPAAFHSLLNFCYTGELKLTKNNVESVLSGACQMEIEEVKDECSEFLKTLVVPGNCLWIRSIAKAQECNSLVEYADEFLMVNFMDVVKEEEFLLLGVKEVIEVLSSDDISVPDEQAVFDILCHWINYDVDKRRGFVSDLLPCVRMRFLSPSFIADKVETNEWFRDDPTCKELISNVIQCHALPEMWEKRNLNGMKVKHRRKYNMYAVGGWGVNSIERYSYEDNKWIKVGEMSSSRYDFGAAVIDNNIWIVGGRDSNGEPTSCCECWNPRTGEWHDLPPMNTPRGGLGVGAVEGILYAVGGYDGSKCLKSMEKWNANTKSWSKVDKNMTPLAEMSTGRSDLGVAVLKGMYVCAVLSPKWRFLSAAVVTHKVFFKTVQKQQKQSVLSSAGFRLYAVGGWNGKERLKSVERYDPHTNQWSSLASMNHRRSILGVGVLNGMLYAVGGWDGSSRLASVERYDPEENKWTFIASLSSPRNGLRVCPLNGFLFAVGGWDGKMNCLDAVEYYNSSEDRWVKVSQFDSEHMIHV